MILAEGILTVLLALATLAFVVLVVPMIWREARRRQ